MMATNVLTSTAWGVGVADERDVDEPGNTVAAEPVQLRRMRRADEGISIGWKWAIIASVIVSAIFSAGSAIGVMLYQNIQHEKQLTIISTKLDTLQANDARKEIDLNKVTEKQVYFSEQLADLKRDYGPVRERMTNIEIRLGIKTGLEAANKDKGNKP